MVVSWASVGIFVLVSLGFFVWVSVVDGGMALIDRLLYFPKRCLGYDTATHSKLLELTTRIFIASFFAALVALFYEIYKNALNHIKIKKAEKAIYNSFLWTSNKSSGMKYRYVPYYKTFVTLRARFGYSEEDIFKACSSSKRLRVVNLATTRAQESYPHDRLAVECYYKNAEYGCKIDRHSQVTIVVPSTHFGLSKFGFYLSYYGDFNFISKENPDHDSSEGYFTISDDESMTDKNVRDFVSEAKGLASNQSSLVIVLSTLPFRNGNKISILHQDGASNRCEDFCGKIADAIPDVTIENKETRISKDNILTRINTGQSSEGFLMKISDETLVWNPNKIKVTRNVAEALCKALGNEFDEKTGKYDKREKWMVGFPEGYFESRQKEHFVKKH